MSKWVEVVTGDSVDVVTIDMMADGTPGEYVKFNDSTGAAESGVPSRTPENKSPVRAATTPGSPSISDLVTSFANGSVLDGVTLATGDRILIKNGIENPLGTYTLDDLAGTPNANGEAEPNNTPMGTWTFNDALAGDPSANGEAKPNNALLASTTSILIFTNDQAGVDRSALIATLKKTNDNVTDRLRIANATFDVTSATDLTTHFLLTVKYISGQTSWASLNEATFVSSPARTTSINFFNSNAAGTDNSAIFANIQEDDLLAIGTLRGHMYVDGPPVDNATYWAVPVRYHPAWIPPWPATEPVAPTMHIHDGIYTVNASGAPTRAADYTVGTNVASAESVVQEGTTNASRIFVSHDVPGADVVGTDALRIATPRVDHYNATGFGGFMISAESSGEFTSVNNGAFNTSTTSPYPVEEAETTGLKFSGKPYTEAANPGWGSKNGLPLHVQGILHQSGGPGCHIIMNQRDDPTKVVIYRNNLQSIPDFSFNFNDDVRFGDLTLLGSTFDFFDNNAIYETTIIPQSPSSGYSGSGRFPISSLISGRRFTWDDTIYMDPGWIDHGLNSTTTLAADYPGIMMPNDGVVLSYTLQTFLRGALGCTVDFKPELTRIRPNEGAGLSVNIDMVNPSLVGAGQATFYNTNSVTVGKQTASLVTGLKFDDQTFKKGDKLVVAFQFISGTNAPDDMKVEWSLQVIFFDAPMLYEGKLDNPDSAPL